jgi:hypothetical protein
VLVESSEALAGLERFLHRPAAAGRAGCSKAFLAYIRGLRNHAVLTEFTVGWAVTDRERAAIAGLPARAWTPAIDAEGQHRPGAHEAE